jgi:hypothetical protein
MNFFRKEARDIGGAELALVLKREKTRRRETDKKKTRPVEYLIGTPKRDFFERIETWPN